MSSSQELFAKALRAADRGTKRRKTRPLWSTGITLVLVFLLGFGLWTVYPKNGENASNAPVPIVRADTKPMKFVPKDPGGMDIPYRESTVFGAVDEKAQEKQAKVEQLLPDAEKPMERSEIFAKLEAEMNEADLKAKETKEAKVVEKPTFTHEVIKPQIPPEFLAKIEKGEKVELKIPEGSAISKEEPKDGTSIEMKKAPVETVDATKVMDSLKKPVKISVVEPNTSKEEATQQVAASDLKSEDTIVALAKEIANTEPSAGAMATEPVKVAGTYYVQLGSVTSEAGADSEWNRLQKSFGDILSGFSYRVKKADLGERGIYYRIQGGPLTEQTAYSVCSDIKAKKPGGCLVIKP